MGSASEIEEAARGNTEEIPLGQQFSKPDCKRTEFTASGFGDVHIGVPKRSVHRQHWHRNERATA